MELDLPETTIYGQKNTGFSITSFLKDYGALILGIIALLGFSKLSRPVRRYAKRKRKQRTSRRKYNANKRRSRKRLRRY